MVNTLESDNRSIEPLQYGTDSNRRHNSRSRVYRRISRRLLSEEGCSRISLRTLLMMAAGGVIGGPCGLLIVKMFHLGSVASFWLPLTGFCTGVGTGKIVAKVGKRRQDPVYELLLSEEDTSRERLSKSLELDDLEEAFPKFLEQFTQEGILRDWYQTRIRLYHQSSSPQDALQEASYLIEDLTELVVETVSAEEKSHTILAVVCVEKLVMMSLYWDLMGQCRDHEVERDNAFRLAREETSHTASGVSDEAIVLLDGLVNKQTASLKISCILAVSEILGKEYHSEGPVNCDILLERFVSAVCRSTIRHPFGELCFMDTFSPEGLKGRESYAVSSFMASVHYILG